MNTELNRRQLIKTGAVWTLLPTLPFSLAKSAFGQQLSAHRPDMSLQAQRERGKRLLAMAAEFGGRYYDEDAGLIVRTDTKADHKHHEKYRGTWVAWRSPEYAIALLETNQNLPRANRIISRICDYLQTDAGEPRFGNAFGVAEWDRVRDTNAIVFLVFKLAPVYLDHRDKLEPEVREKLLRFLELAAVGMIRRAPIWFYSNIFLMTVAGELMLARVLERDDLTQLAQHQWQRWLERTAECSLVESNSPTYYVHQICPTLAVAKYASDEQMRNQARRAADFMFILLTGNYHLPSRSLGGTSCRSYMHSVLNTGGGYELLMHFYFDVPFAERKDNLRIAEKKLVSTTIVPYLHVPCEESQKLVWQRSYPDTFVTRYGSYFGKDYNPVVIPCANYQTDKLSVASQYGVWSHYHQEIPLKICYASDSARRTVFLRGGPTNSLIDSYFNQDENRMLGITYWNPPTYGDLSWWPHGSPFLAEHRLYVGPADDFEIILVNSQPYEGSSTPFRPGDTLFVQKKEFRMMLRAFAPPEVVAGAPARIERTDEGELQLVIEYCHADSVNAFLEADPTAFGMYIEVEPTPSDPPGTSAVGDARRWLKHLTSTKPESAETPSEHWQLRFGELTTTAPVTPSARQNYCENHRPPISKPVVKHPIVTFDSPAELKKWFRL